MFQNMLLISEHSINGNHTRAFKYHTWPHKMNVHADIEAKTLPLEVLNDVNPRDPAIYIYVQHIDRLATKIHKANQTKSQVHFIYTISINVPFQITKVIPKNPRIKLSSQVFTCGISNRSIQTDPIPTDPALLATLMRNDSTWCRDQLCGM